MQTNSFAHMKIGNKLTVTVNSHLQMWRIFCCDQISYKFGAISSHHHEYWSEIPILRESQKIVMQPPCDTEKNEPYRRMFLSRKDIRKAEKLTSNEIKSLWKRQKQLSSTSYLFFFVRCWNRSIVRWMLLIYELVHCIVMDCFSLSATAKRLHERSVWAKNRKHFVGISSRVFTFSKYYIEKKKVVKGLNTHSGFSIRIFYILCELFTVSFATLDKSREREWNIWCCIV